MQFTIASEPGRAGAGNDDWAAASSCGVAVVLDGLTELPDRRACLHGTGWYVHRLGTALLRLAAPAGTAQTGAAGAPLAEALAAAIAEVAALHAETCEPAHPTAPGATVALLRLAGGRAEYLVLSDTVVVLDRADAPEPVVVTDDSVRRHLGELATAAATAAGRDGGAALAALIAAQQRLRNQPDGYWVAQADQAAAAHAVTGSVDGVLGALLLTDGAALLATEFGAASWRELLDLGYAAGPAGIIAATRELEAADPDGAVWPRYKRHDDATAVLCTVRPATAPGR